MNIKENVSLASYTTFSVGGPARYFVVVNNLDELTEAIIFADKEKLSIFVLGEGSNILVSDNGFSGLVIKMRTRGVLFKDIDEGVVEVVAQSGENWDDVVLECVKRGFWGIENMSGIPGTVGAAVVGNIAAYGQAVSDTIHSVNVINTKDKNKSIKEIKASDIGLKYRYSDFQNSKLGSNIITSATFILSRSVTSKFEYKSAIRVATEIDLNTNNITDRRKIILETRKRVGSLFTGTGVGGARTAGSFFRNPEIPVELAKKIIASEESDISKKDILRQNIVHGGSSARVSAAHVLLASGFRRGQKWGEVRLHPKHILKVENLGGATAQDIYDVINIIIFTVEEKFGIKLEPEIRFVGDFKK